MKNVIIDDANRAEFQERLQQYFTSVVQLPADTTADQRINEVAMVCLDGDAIVGVATIVRQFMRQQGFEMWFYRTSVSPDHRHVDIARSLANDLFAHMDAHYTKGDPAGFFYLIEAEVLIKNLPQCVWPTTGAVFIGYDALGRQRRIKYFTNAELDRPWETAVQVAGAANQAQ